MFVLTKHTETISKLHYSFPSNLLDQRILCDSLVKQAGSLLVLSNHLNDWRIVVVVIVDDVPFFVDLVNLRERKYEKFYIHRLTRDNENMGIENVKR